MTTREPNVEVTLTAALYRQLSAEARKLGVSIAWLVASIVADTVDSSPLAAS